MIPPEAFNSTFNDRFDKKEFQKNAIHINEHVKIPIDPQDGFRCIDVGDAGSGKSFLLGVIANQFKNLTLFDTTAKFIENLKKMSCENDWEYYSFTKNDNSNSFKINVSDFGEKIIDSIFPRVEDSNTKRAQRQAVEEFIRQNKRVKKTYSDWCLLCEENKMDYIKRDMDWILSPTDSAPPILFWGQGKKVIECEGLSVKNPSIGVFLYSFIDARGKHSESWCLKPENFVLFALEEAQKYCLQDTPLGNAFAEVSSFARKFGAGSILVAAGYDQMHTGIRANWNFCFVFNSKGLTKKYRKEGIALNFDVFIELEKHKYHCYIFTKDGKFNRKMALPTTFFLETRKDVPALMVEQSEIEFNLDFMLNLN